MLASSCFSWKVSVSLHQKVWQLSKHRFWCISYSVAVCLLRQKYNCKFEQNEGSFFLTWPQYL